ncbi:MAG TPA: RNA polymerase subunit sigma [Myxococcales bacterium]|nr:RNA polymerase subunit sigma [Myxococcales bacterium]
MWFLGWLNKSDPAQDSDETLMLRFQQGQSQALETLYERYSRRLRGYVASLGGARPDDLVQDTFAKVIQKASSFRGDSSFKTWLFVIARNTARDAARRAKIRRTASLDQPLDADSGYALIDQVATSSPHHDPERSAHDATMAAALKVALAALPEDQREVFALRQFSGLSFKEVAAAVGCNENTAKSRMRYALESLRSALQEFR